MNNNPIELPRESFVEAFKRACERGYRYARKHPFRTLLFIMFFYLVLSAGALYLMNRRENRLTEVGGDRVLAKPPAPSSHRVMLSELTPAPSAFLAEQSKMRTYVRNNPGFGDQAAAANVMKALQQRGFNGKFEVVYSKSIANKVASVFNLDKLSSDYHVEPETNITFIAIDAYLDQLQENNVEKVNISYSIGRSGGPCAADEMNNGKITFCGEYTAFLRSRLVIDFDSYLCQFCDTDLLLENTEKAIRQKDSGFSFYVFPTNTFAQAVDYLTKPAGKLLLENKPGLAPFMQGLDEGQFNSMSVYGGTLMEKHCEKYLYSNHEQPENCALANMLQVLASARHAQTQSADLATKPLVISLLYDSEPELLTLRQLLFSSFHFESLRRIPEIQALIKDLQTHLEFIDINDHASVTRLQSLESGKLYLLHVGNLPNVVFDGIYTHTGENVLPSIREGMSSLNKLLLTGRPHLRCDTDWDLNFISPDDQALNQTLHTIYNHYGICDGMSTWEKFPTLPHIVGDLIIEAHNSSSAFSDYARKLKNTALRDENNRIMRAINESERLLSSSMTTSRPR